MNDRSTNNKRRKKPKTPMTKTQRHDPTSFSHCFELRHSDLVISLEHVPRKLSGLAKAERIGYKHPAPIGAEHDSARRQCRRHYWKSATRLAHLRYRTGRKSTRQFAKNPRSTRGRFR